MLSHDWPRGIERHGDTTALLRKKQFFRQEVEQNNLGSPANEDVLNTIKPRWWFSAHLHVKFEATVRHVDGEQGEDGTNRLIGIIGVTPSQVATAKTATVAEEGSNQMLVRLVMQEDEQTTSFVGLESPACPTESSISDLTEQMTRFLSLDKCLPRRQHLQIVNISVRR